MSLDLIIDEKYRKHITYDFETMLYTVWDETSAYEVGNTPYPYVAYAMMDAYVLHYLDPKFEENV